MILFRADGNSSIGSGHIMRCLSIADAGKKAGQECVFITASADFQSTIESHGHKVIVLNTDYRNLDAELDLLRPLARAQNLTAFFADSYYVTSTWLQALHKEVRLAGAKLVYLDDVLAFPYSCDVLINYNIYGPDKKSSYERLYRNTDITVPEMLLGSLYAPLRAEFQGIPERVVKKKAADILVSTGGADAEHMTIELLKAVKAQNTGFTFHFIVGMMNKDKAAVEQLAKGEPGIVIHSNVKHMAELMSACDAAVSAAGSTLYELCAAQTPAVTYILADNQIPGAEGFQRHGVLENCGDVRENGAAELAGRLVIRVQELAGDYEERKRISRKMRAVADGKGAERILERVMGGSLVRAGRTLDGGTFPFFCSGSEKQEVLSFLRER